MNSGISSIAIAALTSTAVTFTTACSAAPLKEKLSAQWTRYEAAQAELLRLSPSPMSRAHWEELLALPQDQALTADEIQELIRSQEARIQEARAQARVASLINLDRLRSLPSPQAQTEIARFCAEMPKGGMLHIHPTGTLKQGTVESLLRKDNPEFDFKAISDKSRTALNSDELTFLEAQTPKATYTSLSTNAQARLMDFFVLPPGTFPFPRFDVTFQFLGTLLQSDDDQFTVFDDFARRAASEGVSYVEFTWNVNPEDAPFLEKIVQRIQSQTGIIARFNKSFSRGQSQEKLLSQAQALLTAAPTPAIVGIDLLGNETDTPALERGQAEYAAVMQAVQAGKSHLHRTMHAGELGDPRDPRDAILLGAERLGHGVKLVEDPVALEYAVRKKIAIEINLNSNLRLRAIDDLHHHPFLKYLRLGLPVSLSTDDEGILNTDINRECETAITESDVTYAELKQMAFNSIETSFADQATQAALVDRLRKSFTQFEGSLSYLKNGAQALRRAASPSSR